MKTIVLLNIELPAKTNIDCMGGYGVGSAFGKGITKLISAGKQNGVYLPLMDYGYIAAYYKSKGYRVELSDRPTFADEVYCHLSIINFKNEIDIASRCGKRIHFIGPIASNIDIIAPELKNVKNAIWHKGEIEEYLYGNKWGLSFYNYPDWSIYKQEFTYFPSLKTKPVYPVSASRGCEYNCGYCPYRMYYGKRRERNVGDVIGELWDLRGRGAKGIVFRDPLFLGNDDWRNKELLKCMAEIQLPFACEVRLESLNEEIFDLLKLAHCRSIHLGVETFNSDSLKGVGRKYNMLEKYKGVVYQARKRGIKTLCFYIIGFPEDDRKSIETTIWAAKKIDSDFAEFFVCTPYPGTALYKKLALHINKPFEQFNGFQLVYRHNKLIPNEIESLRQRAYQEFYFRPQFLARHAVNCLRGI